jgi:branched-chain amino acid transport system permease protein
MDIRTSVESGKMTPARIASFVGLGLAVVLIPIMLQGFGQILLVRVLALVGIYVMLALGLNIVVGYAGLLDLGYVAFYAMGAYSSIIIGDLFVKFINAHMSGNLASFWTGSTWILMLPVAAIFAAMTGITLGTPVLRLRGD